MVEEEKKKRKIQAMQVPGNQPLSIFPQSISLPKEPISTPIADSLPQDFPFLKSNKKRKRAPLLRVDLEGTKNRKNDRPKNTNATHKSFDAALAAFWGKIWIKHCLKS